MAEASIDIRIFPNKELTSVDMAEIMDAALPNTGVIQGCELHLVNGVFNIDSGRLVVGGRLGVVTGGTIPNPTTLTTTSTCYLLAVCDLSNSETPFYFKLATVDELDRLGLSIEDVNTTFNINSGLRALFFGYCTVNPATGLASDWHALDQATARKGRDWWGALYSRIEALEEKQTWKLVQDRDISGSEGTFNLIPAGAREIFVSVFIQWTTTQKICVDFYIPVVPHMFNPYEGQTQTSHVNYWSKDYNGFVRIGTHRSGNNYYVKLLEAYNKETNVLNNTYYRVYYR